MKINETYPEWSVAFRDDTDDSGGEETSGLEPWEKAGGCEYQWRVICE